MSVSALNFWGARAGNGRCTVDPPKQPYKQATQERTRNSSAQLGEHRILKSEFSPLLNIIPCWVYQQVGTIASTQRQNNLIESRHF